jgi:hypothetical protein
VSWICKRILEWMRRGKGGRRQDGRRKGVERGGDWDEDKGYREEEEVWEE